MSNFRSFNVQIHFKMMNCTLYIYTNTYVCIKGIVRPKMEILSPV